MANATELMFCVFWAAVFGFVIGQITDMKAIVEWFKRRFCIVRCKDCKYWSLNDPEKWDECRWSKDETPNEDDYCSYGERKEE